MRRIGAPHLSWSRRSDGDITSEGVPQMAVKKATKGLESSRFPTMMSLGCCRRDLTSWSQGLSQQDVSPQTRVTPFLPPTLRSTRCASGSA